jgi:hypothetical protein
MKRVLQQHHIAMYCTEIIVVVMTEEKRKVCCFTCARGPCVPHSWDATFTGGDPKEPVLIGDERGQME